MVAGLVRTAFAETDAERAAAQWRDVADRLRERCPRSGAPMDEAEADVLAHMGFPKAHRPQLHSTNPPERLDREIKRRADALGIFPNDRAVIRLAGAVLRDPDGAVRRVRRPAPLHGPGTSRRRER